MPSPSKQRAPRPDRAARLERRRAAVPKVSYPPELPVSARRDELLAAIRDHQVVVVAGETGSGKTTQLPKLCLELGRGIEGTIAHTQPRRLAARTVSARIAEELNVPLGSAVGYAVRFSDRTRDDTLVRLMTDGLLLAEIRRDRLLRRYDTVIVDEAHERSLNIDFLLGYLARLLPRRPDLKVIVTSATIDPQRFSEHFGGAPIVEVSGRTYPVEVRYRPVVDPADPEADADRDQADAIADAVAELERAGPGDVLVFLSGEREIRDTAELLRGRVGPEVEILPLYARLSTAEQQRVFHPSGAKRRVVLATNVAETSLTVPGIRYVVDPGTARISRYSARLKVQRLPIESVSQASADQRKGRCGRTSDGICIRLYTEEDFGERPRFTEPEILRTNLASVILQMAALGLGSVEDFPFMDPPDKRQVRDGVALLRELGALEDGRTDADRRAEQDGGSDADRRAEQDGHGRAAEGEATTEMQGVRRAGSGAGAAAGDERARGPRLTKLGRRLAHLPVDPRLGRMVLEADRLGCADEVIVIAAGLSIQDPRERPPEQQGAADQAHARFADEESDFLTYLNLWRYLGEQQRALSGSQFRKRCRKEFLHYLRVREWQDLVAQLHEAARRAHVTVNQQPAKPREIHTALLSGLLSHVGVRDVQRRDYQGARGARFAIFPGSGLARKQPAWVMVAELVETSRLWGRTAARIQPAWVEPLAEHLIKRTYSEPRWDPERGSVVATERATLYGLPVVAGRTVAYGRIDPAVSRELFIRRALVEGEWEGRHAFLERNATLIEEIEALERRERRRDLLVGDQVLHDFYDARIPADVVSGGHFNRWWREARQADPELLTFPRELLLAPQAAATLDPRARPRAWKQGDLTLALSYEFEPGSEHDGVTVHVPLRILPQLRARGFDWLVPGMRLELVTTLLRMLPKELRRPLVPVPDTAAAILGELTPRREPLREALAVALERRGVRVPPGVWDADALPAHLRMTFRIEDEDGNAVAQGHDLAALGAAARPRLQADLAAATPDLERRGLTAWTIGELPREIALPGTGGAVRAFPALVDEGATVGVRAFDTPAQQQVAMAAGTRRLLLLNAPAPLRHLRGALSQPAQLTLMTAPHGSLEALVDDAATAAVDALLAEAGGPAWDEAGFARLRGHVAGNLVDATERTVRQVVAILDAARDVEQRLDAILAEPLQPVRHDVAAQLGRLLFPGFVAATGPERLPDVERYLRAAERRLERLPATLAADRDKMGVAQELEREYAERLAAVPPGVPIPAALREARWMLEELRVSQFAQGLAVRGAGPGGKVSAKRIRALLA